ncbi:tRNA dihydrouridine(20/20a) synthase DusA [Salinicola rhizosphaerae]|uniref:tRNA-dihydrouridine(20/20a) synthase n=1 Tax=Salinicola rhizosphaerae TaxID=1443141 RepID=A0ABQ3E2E9_9GAMM|nr:tRNA dihydrouridine(20/20a) synthase DusA [Salinicola rhizosphaerae]GHB23701.1 tRNA-dihydrouridine(20/20a) synthase [Salinicola rhizosphaerae]
MNTPPASLTTVASHDRLDRTLSVAPMMEWTTRDYRAFARCLTKRTLLYTEMVTTGAILHGTPRERFLGYDDLEHPLALQLGGSDPVELAECAAIAQSWGYDEVNLNVGCPSDRVQNNLIGACLMAHPEKVADAVEAMQRAVSIPVTVKCRIGIDDQDEDADLERFIEIVAAGGCDTFIIHARKAWLQGLSPKENREVPPLNYERVYRLKRQHPDLHIGINGGIKTLTASQEHLESGVDSVMIGREAYQNPWLLADVDSRLYDARDPVMTRHEAARAFRPYLVERLAQGVKLNHVTRHLLGLFQGCPGGRRFRRHLSENAHREGAGIGVFDDALGMVDERQLDATSTSATKVAATSS